MQPCIKYLYRHHNVSKSQTRGKINWLEVCDYQFTAFQQMHAVRQIEARADRGRAGNRDYYITLRVSLPLYVL